MRYVITQIFVGFQITDLLKKIIDVFVYEMGREEKDLAKRQKIDNLALDPGEWEDIKLFNDLLAVRPVQSGMRMIYGSTIYKCCIAFGQCPARVLIRSSTNITPRSTRTRSAPQSMVHLADSREIQQVCRCSRSWSIEDWGLLRPDFRLGCVHFCNALRSTSFNVFYH